MSKLELAARKYAETIKAINEDEVIISRMSFRKGYLLKASEAEVREKFLVDCMKDCILYLRKRPKNTLVEVSIMNTLEQTLAALSALEKS